jgi:hypothetical protein
MAQCGHALMWRCLFWFSPTKLLGVFYLKRGVILKGGRGISGTASLQNSSGSYCERGD